MYWADIALTAVSSAQLADGTHPPKNHYEFAARFPVYDSVFTLLLENQFIREIKVKSEEAFPWRITFRGLLLQSILADIVHKFNPSSGYYNDDCLSDPTLAMVRKAKEIGQVFGFTIVQADKSADV